MADDNQKVPGLTVDACGLKCPMPILKAKKALANMESGALLTVLTTDPGAKGDFHFFCSQTGNTLVEQTEKDGVFTIVIRRKQL